MVYAIVWGYAIVGVGLNFQGATMTTYTSSAVLTIGLSTLLQGWIGHRMAMVHGPNVIPSLAIVAELVAAGEAYALQSFTAQATAGLIIVALVYLGAVRDSEGQQHILRMDSNMHLAQSAYSQLDTEFL